MKARTKISHRIHRAAQYIENPRLFMLQKRGIDPELYRILNQPWFHAFSIATVLDIGANTGRSALTFRAVLPQAYIYSFEPLPDCYEQLQLRMKGETNYVGFNIGIGDQSGDLEFERNVFTEASSFLTMTDVHREAWPHARNTETMTVRVERLDDVAQRLTIAEPFLVKVDVQGYEDRVLRGGQQTIGRAQLVIIETSYTRLYEAQPPFDDIYRTLTHGGFTYAGATGHIIDPQTGKALAEDSIFVRNSA